MFSISLIFDAILLILDHQLYSYSLKNIFIFLNAPLESWNSSKLILMYITHWPFFFCYEKVCWLENIFPAMWKLPGFMTKHK